MVSIELMFLLFLLSVILCAIGGEVVKRKELQISKLVLAIFHLFYVGGLVAVYLLL